MKLLKNNRGVTLVALIITIIILLILATTATFSGVSTMQSAKMTTFITEIKLIESNISTDNEGNKIINGQLISEKGDQIDTTNVDIVQMKENLKSIWNVDIDLSGYKYFDSNKLSKELSIEGIKQVTPIIINVENGTVISVKGVKYQGKIYYTLQQTPDNLNKVTQENTNQDIPTFNISTESTSDEMEIILNDIVIKAQYVKKYKVEYQAVGNNSWTLVAEDLTSDKYSFSVKAAGKYNVRIVDTQNNESQVKEIEVVSNKTLIADGSWNNKKGVNTPQIEGTGLIPIYFNDDGSEVEVTADNQDNWYNYSDQKWANAKTEDGSYWVWIPRYAYKITSGLGTSTTGEIAIKFVDTNNKNGTVTYSENYPSIENEAMSDFVVHPAFTTNVENGGWSENISGFWVAKYAAGFQECTQTIDSDGNIVEPTIDKSKVIYSNKNYTSNNENYSINALGQNLSNENYNNEKLSCPVFKPLTYAYNLISTSDSFDICREIENIDFYGLNCNYIDSHMMKNSEWGAVAYLSHSAFGRNKNEITINSKNLNNINSKNIYAVTGYENDIANGLNASSTQNRSGVFDLNGCVWERTSGFISNGNSNLMLYGKSLLKSSKVIYNMTDATKLTGSSTKYVSIYPYNKNDDNNANNWIEYKNKKTDVYGYGDNILEISKSGSDYTSWNEDCSLYPGTENPFFIMGGYNDFSEKSGIFSFGYDTGESLQTYGFRAVLIPE